eukprot:6225498-Pyramimonas_sp.AAC.1
MAVAQSHSTRTISAMAMRRWRDGEMANPFLGCTEAHRYYTLSVEARVRPESIIHPYCSTSFPFRRGKNAPATTRAL